MVISASSTVAAANRLGNKGTGWTFPWVGGLLPVVDLTLGAVRFGPLDFPVTLIHWGWRIWTLKIIDIRQTLTPPRRLR